MRNLLNSLRRNQIDWEEIEGLRWKMPDGINVRIEQDPDTGYIAYITVPTKFDHSFATQGNSPQELFEMVNDAVFTMLDIPENYRPYFGSFLPPEKIRAEMNINIPKKYLNKELGFVKA